MSEIYGNAGIYLNLSNKAVLCDNTPPAFPSKVPCSVYATSSPLIEAVTPVSVYTNDTFNVSVSCSASAKAYIGHRLGHYFG